MHIISFSSLVRPLALTLTILLSAVGASAQLVSDGATATINGTATNIASFLTIGNTGPNTTLIVTNGGSVTADNAGIGGTATSSNNLVAVSGAGSRMTTPGGGSVFRIGNGAAFNRLLISEGGAVTTGYGVVGYPVGASNNFVLVTGNGSAWTNSVLYVGEGAMNNSVTVANGGQVQTSFASAIGVVAGASNNWVTVTGPDSLWSTANNVLVGDADGQNRLFVNNGGTVTSGANIILGNQSTSGGNLLSVAAGTATATNASGTGTLDVRRGNVEFNDGLIAADQLLLTDAQGSFTFNGGTLITRGATINNGQDFTVGANAGTGAAGATFANTTATTIPNIGSATPYPSVINVANVGGSITKITVTLSNLSHTYPNDLEVLLVGPDGQKVLLMSDAGGLGPGAANVNLTFDDAAALPVPPASLPSGTYRPTDIAPGDLLPLPAPAGAYSTNLATFNGSSANGAWSLYISDDAGGDSGSLGAWSLNIVTTPASANLANDALITINDWVPATPYPSVINVTNLAGVVSRVTVTVSNFTHTASYDVDLLLVNPEGAAVALMRNAGENLAGATLTFDDAATSSLPVNGSTASGTYRPTTYFITDSLPVPAPAAPYSPNLAIFKGSNPNGGWSLFVNDRLGGDIGAISNGWSLQLETITPATWDVRSNATPTTVAGKLYIGLRASNSRLLITNGAVVANDIGYLGFNSDANNNVALVTGAGSLWTNSSSLYVSYAGSGNQLMVSNGGVVANSTGVLGSNPDASNNVAVVTGAGSRWTSSGDLHVGLYGSGNQMAVSNGGVVANNNGFLGYNTDAISNVAVVTGAGSHWTNSGILRVGNAGSGNQLVVSNGAVVANSSGFLGYNPDASNNLAVVTGAGSRWNNSGELRVGHLGSGNQLTVGDGGVVANSVSILGFDSTASNNVALVTGPNSLWTNSSGLNVGYFSGGNQVTVSNGAVVASSYGFLGSGASAGNNVVSVTGPNSRWSNSGDLRVGEFGSRNHLVVSNGGTVSAANVFVGFEISSANRVTVDGGTLRATNSSGNAVFDIRRGTNVLNAGLIEVDSLLMNNSAGFFTFNGGEFRARTANVANGAVFTVGNGSSAATYEMIGLSGNPHTFNDGFTIANNATLKGNGSLPGLTVLPGGTVAPGASIGTIGLNTQPLLQGHVIMEIAKNGTTLTKDLISVGDYVIYGGSLTVSNLGPTALALGDSFQIFFSFDNNYGGSFASISLPPLPAGLKWSNQLLANGTIAVVTKTAPTISGLTKTGTNLIYNVTGGSPGAPWYRLTATNVALPLANWTTNGTGVFDWVGNVTITNGINFAEPQRYFRISAP